MVETIIIGIGNPFRSDDGVGWTVVELLERKMDPSVVMLSKQRGDIAELLEAFAEYRNVFLIDACKGIEDGWQRIDFFEKPVEIESHQTSTHGLNISQAIELAKNLDQLPQRLVIYAIAGECYQMGNALSPSVAKAAVEVVEAITKEPLCMSKV